MLAKDSDSMLGQVLEGRYRLLERLGTGGIGTVYRGERLKVRRNVAIKFLQRQVAKKDGFVKRFEREAMAMSRLYHQNCVALIDFGMHENAPYLVMEFVPGITLTQAMREGKLAPARAIGIMRQLCDALGYFHRRHVVHRDLKPDNIMLMEATGEGDMVKILDFGMAKLLGGAGADMELSVKGVVVGTPSAMSPEQIRQKGVDHRSDIYAAGILFYEMLVGSKPFRHKDPLKVLEMQLKTPPVPPNQLLGDDPLSDALQSVVLRAMAKRCDDRFQSAEEMSRAMSKTPEHKSRRRPSLDSHTGDETAPTSAKTSSGWAKLGWLLFVLGVGGAGLSRVPAVRAMLGWHLHDENAMANTADAAQLVAATVDAGPRADAAEQTPKPWHENRDRAVAFVEASEYRLAMREVRRALRQDPDARFDRRLIESVIATLALPRGDEYIPFLVSRFGGNKVVFDSLVDAVAHGENWYVRHHSLVALSQMGGLQKADKVAMWLMDLEQAKSCATMYRPFSALKATGDARAVAAFAEIKKRDKGDRHVRCLKFQLGLARRPVPVDAGVETETETGTASGTGTDAATDAATGVGVEADTQQ